MNKIRKVNYRLIIFILFVSLLINAFLLIEKQENKKVGKYIHLENQIRILCNNNGYEYYALFSKEDKSVIINDPFCFNTCNGRTYRKFVNEFNQSMEDKKQ